jgi:hypothetical protein
VAHWAELDETNKVIRVIVTDNESPDEGYSWIIENLGGNWVKTSYNSYGGVHYTSEIDEYDQRVPSGKPHLRYNYAGIDYLYDPIVDAFIPPKPEGEGWELSTETYLWENKYLSS